MVRPPKERRIEQMPDVIYYKPAGIPLRNIEEIILTFEEMEAIRLADIEQLNQGASAERMGISRPTFHRLVNRAHQKIATAMWQGKALKIEGGSFKIDKHRVTLKYFTCQKCDIKWTVPYNTNLNKHSDLKCPDCESDDINET